MDDPVPSATAADHAVVAFLRLLAIAGPVAAVILFICTYLGGYHGVFDPPDPPTTSVRIVAIGMLVLAWLCPAVGLPLAIRSDRRALIIVFGVELFMTGGCCWCGLPSILS